MRKVLVTTLLVAATVGSQAQVKKHDINTEISSYLQKKGTLF